MSESTQPSYYPVLKQVFAALGFVFFSFQLAPQVWKNYKNKNTEGLATAMIMIWYIASLLLAGYAVGIGLTILVIIQPQIFTAFNVAVLVQIFYYMPNNPSSYFARKGYRIPMPTAWLIFFGALALSAAIVAGLYFAIRYAYDTGQNSVILALGYLPTVFVFIGFLPQFWEIYRYKRVMGISLMFLLIDALGGIFNTISLAFHETFDIPAATCFLVIAACDLLIIALYFPLEAAWRKNNPAEAAAEAAAKRGEVVVDEMAAKEIGDKDAGSEDTAVVMEQLQPLPPAARSSDAV
ncbi:hypothetical protein DFJ74DRAFT_639610 [Hyaloraphidium curvatum]|nr:hypothetical protein DFJ74DRAFT_639610 [Hyaloraphidium curvatum]